MAQGGFSSCEDAGQAGWRKMGSVCSELLPCDPHARGRCSFADQLLIWVELRGVKTVQGCLERVEQAGY